MSMSFEAKIREIREGELLTKFASLFGHGLDSRYEFKNFYDFSGFRLHPSPAPQNRKVFKKKDKGIFCFNLCLLACEKQRRARVRPLKNVV